MAPKRAFLSKKVVQKWLKKCSKKMFGHVFLEGWRKGFFRKMFKKWSKTEQKVLQKWWKKSENGTKMAQNRARACHKAKNVPYPGPLNTKNRKNPAKNGSRNASPACNTFGCIYEDGNVRKRCTSVSKVTEHRDPGPDPKPGIHEKWSKNGA